MGFLMSCYDKEELYLKTILNKPVEDEKQRGAGINKRELQLNNKI